MGRKTTKRILISILIGGTALAAVYITAPGLRNGKELTPDSVREVISVEYPWEKQKLPEIQTAEEPAALRGSLTARNKNIVTGIMETLPVPDSKEYSSIPETDGAENIQQPEPPAYLLRKPAENNPGTVPVPELSPSVPAPGETPAPDGSPVSPVLFAYIVAAKNTSVPDGGPSNRMPGQEPSSAGQPAGNQPLAAALEELMTLDSFEYTDVARLRRIFSNNDIVGYLTIEGTAISYPVVQAQTNEYYLRRALDGTYSVAGTLFMDYENNASGNDMDGNTVIYGHNMRNGSMFHDLRYYTDAGFFREHPYVTLITASGETLWEIFAFYETKTDFNYIATSFSSPDAFFGLLLQMKLNSLYDTGVSVGREDKVLTLSTCSGESDDSRYVLNARLVKQ